jgi:SAM-dependent methyltransferase
MCLLALIPPSAIPIDRTGTMAGDVADRYRDFFQQRDPVHVYPVEFVVRAYLGSYPRLPRRESALDGGRILDLGCGDGRNLPLLSHLGLKVYAVDIAPEICEQTMARMRRLGVTVEARVGRNCRIPFEDRFFDHVLACHSCYYVDHGTRFEDNAAEIARVMISGGQFVFSAPIGTSYIFHGAVDSGGGHMTVANDPYGLRNGCLLRKFDSEEEIESALDTWFTDFRIGACRNDFWGIEEHVWTVVCRRRNEQDSCE